MDSIKTRKALDVECLGAYEEDDDFIDGDINFGKPISTFSFGMNQNSQQNEVPANVQPEQKILESPLPENNTYTPTLRGLTPPVNGEHYTVKRSYRLRPSTVRKLNELKAKHPDLNVFFNTIIDMTILHYHNYTFFTSICSRSQHLKLIN